MRLFMIHFPGNERDRLGFALPLDVQRDRGTSRWLRPADRKSRMIGAQNGEFRRNPDGTPLACAHEGRDIGMQNSISRSTIPRITGMPWRGHDQGPRGARRSSTTRPLGAGDERQCGLATAPPASPPHAAM